MWYVPGVELTCEPQQVDLNKAARWHPSFPSGMHFPAARDPPFSLTAVLQQLERFDSAPYNPTGQLVAGVA